MSRPALITVAVNRREAALRFMVGLVSGLVFGGVAGLKLAAELGLEGNVGAPELMLAGSALTSLSAWWALGVFARLARQWSRDGGADGR